MSNIEYNLPEYPCKEDMWDNLAKESRPIIVYGMGNGADKLFRRFEKYGITVSDIFASDGFVRGHEFHGMRVKSFSEIKAEYSDFVIILSFASSRPEVLDMLRKIDSEYEMYIPDMPVAGEEEYFDKDFYNANYDSIKKALDSLSDEESRRCFCSIVNYKLSGKMSYLNESLSDKASMYSLIGKERVLSYIDAGAYNGDTLREAMENFPNLKKAYLIEPDSKNFKKLNKFTENIEQIDINLYNAALWREAGFAEFSSGGNRNSSVNSTKSYENKTDTVRLISIDEILPEGVDYVKYDVEGAEYEALVGSERVIDSFNPVLLVSLYHRSRDIFFLINYLRERYAEKYEFHLLRLPSVPAWEINLIALPSGT